MNVRPSSIDILVTSLGFGTILLLIVLLLIYLAVHLIRRRHAKHGKREGATAPRPKSKADRPLWVASLCLAGSVWIACGMQTGGTVYFDLESSGSCAAYRFMGVYLFGYVLWLALVLYKLVRKYFQIRLVRKRTPHALACVMMLILPLALYCIPAAVFDGVLLGDDGKSAGRMFGVPAAFKGFQSSVLSSGRGEFHVCYSSVQWHSGLLLFLLALYGGLFVFFVVQIRRAIGTHHEIIRYTIFLSTSLVYAATVVVLKVLPEVVLRVPRWQHLSARVPLAWERGGFLAVAGSDQLLALLSVAIVLFNMAHIFALVLRRKPHTPRSALLRSLGDDGPLRQTAPAADYALSLTSVVSSDDGAEDDMLAMANVLMSERPLESIPVGRAATGPGGDLFTMPRRVSSEEMLPQFERYLEGREDADLEEIDRNCGFYAI